MARIIKTIEIRGQSAVALFDTGATYTYVRSSFLVGAPRQAVSPVRVVLGGQTIEIAELCLMNGKIEGLDFFGDAVPVAQLGSADGHDLDAVIGALTLERWEIKLDPKTGTLDLEGLRRREFTEF
jgi:predicted aspartyl protease